MVQRFNGAGLYVLGLIVVQSSLNSLLDVVDGHHRLQMAGQLLHLQTLDLVVEVPHRHFTRLITEIGIAGEETLILETEDLKLSERL